MTCPPAPISNMLWAPRFEGSGSFPFISDRQEIMYFLFTDEQVAFIVPPIRLVTEQLPSGVSLPIDAILTAEMRSTEISSINILQSTKAGGYLIVDISGRMRSRTAISLNEGGQYSLIVEETPFEMLAGSPRPPGSSMGSTIGSEPQSAPQLNLVYDRKARSSSIDPGLALNQAMVFGEKPWFGREGWRVGGGSIPLTTGYIAPGWYSPSP